MWVLGHPSGTLAWPPLCARPRSVPGYCLWRLRPEARRPEAPTSVAGALGSLHHPEVSGSRNRLMLPSARLALLFPLSAGCTSPQPSSAPLAPGSHPGSAPRCSASRHVHKTLAPVRALSTRTHGLSGRAPPASPTHAGFRKLALRAAPAPEEHGSSCLASPATDLCCRDQKGRSPGSTGLGSERGRPPEGLAGAFGGLKHLESTLVETERS